MRRVACALSAPTACYGFCCRDSGRVGADVCRWCNPPRSSLGTGELSPCIGHGSHVPAGKTENDCGDSRLDSAHEPRQPVVGAPRVHGELLKLGIEVAQSTVAKYLRRHRKPPMQTWRTFLTNPWPKMRRSRELLKRRSRVI